MRKLIIALLLTSTPALAHLTAADNVLILRAAQDAIAHELLLCKLDPSEYGEVICVHAGLQVRVENHGTVPDTLALEVYSTCNDRHVQRLAYSFREAILDDIPIWEKKFDTFWRHCIKDVMRDYPINYRG